MSRAAPGGEPPTWLHFVRRSGEEGRRWAEEYRRVRPLEELGARSLGRLRERRLEEGRELLARFGEGLRSAGDLEPSVRSVLERWYYGVLGYQLYCMEAWDPAERAMVQAHGAVAAAIGERRFLAPLANHCQEFRLHRARIARNRRRWDEMWSHVEEARRMAGGELPFCVLRDGTPVGIAAVQEFFAAVPALSPAERDSLAGLLDDAVRMAEFEQFVRGMLRVPELVIPYP